MLDGCTKCVLWYTSYAVYLHPEIKRGVSRT